jgi:23S rRNA C2498 (ribose-2'-O)-methylase RlmM
MKADTYIEFQRINGRIDCVVMALEAIDKKLDSIIVGLDDKDAAKALADQVRASTKRLQDAIPNLSA